MNLITELRVPVRFVGSPDARIQDTSFTSIQDFTFTDDGASIIAMMENDSVRKFDAWSGRELDRIDYVPDSLVTFSALPGGKGIMFSLVSNEVGTWRFGESRPRWRKVIDEGGILFSMLSPDGENVAVNGRGGPIFLLRTDSGSLVRRFENAGAQLFVSNHELAVSFYGSAEDDEPRSYILDIATGQTAPVRSLHPWWRSDDLEKYPDLLKAPTTVITIPSHRVAVFHLEHQGESRLILLDGNLGADASRVVPEWIYRQMAPYFARIRLTSDGVMESLENTELLSLQNSLQARLSATRSSKQLEQEAVAKLRRMMRGRRPQKQ